MISLRGCSSPSASDSIASGIRAATPLGPNGSPMSVEVNTSRDSLPSAWPSCEPNAMPPICVIIASSGPAIALASSGSDEAHTVEICSATGSHNRFQVSRVLSTQSLGVQATDLVVPAGRAVDTVEPRLGEAHGVGDRRAGLLADGRDEPDRTRCELAGEVVVHRA